MTTMPDARILDRIKDAPSDSRIAVFKDHKLDKLDAVFDSTVRTQHLIKYGIGTLVGVFDKSNYLEAQIRIKSAGHL